MAGTDPQTGAGTRFGKFLLLKKLASGGMGEIFLAKQTGLVGFEKILCIKRILQHHLNNKQYVDMFFSEARIAAMLSHTNVIQVYDMGEVDEHFYIAMEYVHGRSLKEVITRANNNNNPIPLAYVADIASQACAGLSYSHNLNDAAGQPLNVIHRDINPHNVLLSYLGDVKIIDFGIAKSTMQVSKTEAGTIKGKFIYMSPEQSAAEPLDKRSDIFSISIVLYELLAGFNPFQRDNIVLSLEAIQRRDPRPVTEVREDASHFLPILQKGLAKDREERYSDCAEMREDLQRLLQESIVDRPPRPIGEWLEELFADRIEEDRQILLETGSGLSPALGDAGAAGLASSESTEAVSVSSADAPPATLGPSEPTAAVESSAVDQAIGDVFADSDVISSSTQSESPEDDVFSASQPNARVVREFDEGFTDEKTRRLTTDEATRHDRGPLGLGAATGVSPNEATSAFAPPLADREETKEYEPLTPTPTPASAPTASQINAVADALEARPAPSRALPIVAAAVVLLLLLIIVAVVVGRGSGGTEESVDAAGVIAVAAIDATAAAPAATDAAVAAPQAVDATPPPAPAPDRVDAATPIVPTVVDSGAAAPAVPDASLAKRDRPDAARAPDRARPDTVDAGKTPRVPKDPQRKPVIGVLTVNPGIGNTVSLGGRGGGGARQFPLRTPKGSFIVSGSKLKVTVDYRVAGDAVKLRVDSKPWTILSDGGLSMGRTPQSLGAKRRFSLEFRSPKLTAPAKVIVIFKPSG